MSKKLHDQMLWNTLLLARNVVMLSDNLCFLFKLCRFLAHKDFVS